MNDPVKRRHGEWDWIRVEGFLFWYWLPVAAAAIALTFRTLGGQGDRQSALRF
jgi:hypothetical protein